MTDRNELERLLAAATPGPWGIAAYYTGTGPDERCHGMIVSDGDWPTGVIDENESPTSDSLSHDLALICFLRNNVQHYLSLMDEVERLETENEAAGRNVAQMQREVVKLREALCKCADLVLRYNGYQNKKLDDIPAIVAQAPGETHDN